MATTQSPTIPELAVMAELKPRDRKLVATAVDEVIGTKNADKNVQARRWATKAFKQLRGTRKTSMRPGEDGLTDKERTKILELCNFAPTFVDENRSKLGFTK